MAHLRLVTSTDDPTTSEPDRPLVPIRLLLALSGRCDCVDCCAVELARRAGREWVHPDLRGQAQLRVVR